jgi:hypothetical protein
MNLVGSFFGDGHKNVGQPFILCKRCMNNKGILFLLS